MSDPPRPTDVWVAPYLRLEDRLRAGPWEIIPANTLTANDCASTHALEQARGLIELYRRPRRVHQASGCFLRRGRTVVGDDYPQRDLVAFRRALLVGVLDANTTPWRGGPVDHNWGWRTCS